MDLPRSEKLQNYMNIKMILSMFRKISVRDMLNKGSNIMKDDSISNNIINAIKSSEHTPFEDANYCR